MPDQQLTYIEAINAALVRALDEIPETLLFGEDVGRPGGVFGATRGLQKRFGPRVFDTPISESAILGGAVGSALLGRRPIVEIMWVDFALVALDQIVNQAANVRYVSNGALTAPITIRTQQGALPGSCAQHSQNLEAFFAHVPGIRVAMPATAQDAYDMLLGAVYCDDPVIVIENRGLYRGGKQTVHVDGPVPPIGGAAIRRVGGDVTLVSWGAMTYRALEAAATLAADGIDVEVIDARWLNPFDTDLVLASVAKTSRLAVVHEANVTGGFGAEVVARVASEGIYYLDAPVLRLGTPDSRIPAAPALQAAMIPSAQSIADAVGRLVTDHS